MSGQTVVMCPQCGGNKVKSTAAAFKDILTLGVLACVTIIGIPIGVILIITAFVMKYSSSKLKFRCQECKHDFKIQEDAYNTYTKAIS